MQFHEELLEVRIGYAVLDVVPRESVSLPRPSARATAVMSRSPRLRTTAAKALIDVASITPTRARAFNLQRVLCVAVAGHGANSKASVVTVPMKYGLRPSGRIQAASPM